MNRQTPKSIEIKSRNEAIPPNFYTVANTPAKTILLETKYIVPLKLWGGVSG